MYIKPQANKKINDYNNSIYDIQIPGSNSNNNNSSLYYIDIYTRIYPRVVSLFTDIYC